MNEDEKLTEENDLEDYDTCLLYTSAFTDSFFLRIMMKTCGVVLMKW